MKARSLLSGSAYGPERLKEICRAFDEAWEAIRPVVDDTPLAHEAARLQLANMILRVAKGEAIDDSGAGNSRPAVSPPARNKTSA